ncbi:MAG: flagellar type III secretion system pore protein FliP [Planctomycetes bacterium]|nr:flagellar type III secretion system pore protein FliP [Planctomycetota bacterium]
MVRGADRRLSVILLAATAMCLAAARPALAQADAAAPSIAAGAFSSDESPIFIPDLGHLLPKAQSKESISTTLQILVLMTLLTVLPSVVLMMTCFTRMVIVLVLLRQAMGTQSLPPSQVVVGLAFFMSLLVMTPTINRIRADSVQPYLDGELAQMDAIAGIGRELREFMFNQIEAARNEDDVYMFTEYARQAPIPATEIINRADVPMTALIPAFILSELKTAFIIGFKFYLPFLVIDMVIATVLVSMGMMMLPPVMISLPFKLLLFVLADGWTLVAGSLMSSIAT